MPVTDQRQTSRWFVYFVTITLGIAFSVIMLLISWNNALENNKREFSLQSISLKESVARSIIAAHNATHNLATHFLANADLTRDQFEFVVNTILEQYSFIDGALYSPVIALEKEISAQSVGLADDPDDKNIFRFIPEYQVTRKDIPLVEKDIDLLTVDRYRDAIMTSLQTGKIITAVEAGDTSTGRHYWLFKVLGDIATPAQADTNRTVQGLIALRINTKSLLGTTVPNSDLAITMYNDSASLNGRQLLFGAKTLNNMMENSFSVTSFNEEDLTQLPMYSVKLAINKKIHWQEIEKDGLYIALLIGVGVTLLLVALVRAKDMQAKELRERNILIEQKVEEQTKELALARDKALDASRVKSEFLASMSHEIRTPLNAIIGMSELLSETTLSAEQKEYISVFRKAGDNLLALVNDILDLSKIEAKQLVLEHISFNIVETIEESVEIYALKATEKGVELLSHIDSDIEPIRKGDPSRLKQIILNLISNALKFTDHGEIVVNVVNDTEHDDKHYLHIFVSDTGIGIPTDKLEAIFSSFTQADSSTTRKYGGTGLGLTISRSLVEMMNGKIWVESEQGNGSTFHFTVRLEITEMVTAPHKIPVDISDKHILVIDDNATNRLILNKQLSRKGAVVSEANNAQTALELFEKQQQNSEKRFDVILMDCHMPGTGGFELTESLKSKGIDSKIIMMLSSSDLQTYSARATELGLGAYLTKPIKRDELVQKIGEAVSKVNPVKKSRPSIETQQVENKSLKILLVEDNPDNRLLIRAYLKKLPYELDEAENGKIALEKFQEAKYDLVLMDVQMPVMDGHQATRAMREWEKQAEKDATPIIALTAHAIKEEIDKCIAAGCDTHLSKPVKKATLIESIQEITA